MTSLTLKVEGSGPPLVLVHGFLGGANVWARQFPAFSPHWQVIAPNLAGFGDSSGIACPHSISTHADQIFDTLDALGIAKFSLLGHSMGGMVVQQMAAMAPDRIEKLVLYGTGPIGVLPDRFETIETSRARFRNEGFEPNVRRIAATWFRNGEAGEEYELCVREGLKSSVSSALASLDAWENWDGRSNLARLRMPTLVIWGDRDRSYGWKQPEHLWKGIPGSSLAVVPGCAHNVHMEASTLFNDLVFHFLRGF